VAGRSPGGGSARIRSPASCCYRIGQAGQAWSGQCQPGGRPPRSPRSRGAASPRGPARSTWSRSSVEQFLDGEDPPKLRWRAESGRG